MTSNGPCVVVDVDDGVECPHAATTSTADIHAILILRR
jgi:hypothetical protein